MGYFGRYPIKQFIRGKPIRFGFKEWALCSATGYTYKFSVYQGAKTQASRPRGMLLGSEVVLDLLDGIPKGVSVHFDNFFTNMPLLQQLTDKEVVATGTIRLSRVPDNPFGSKKELMKKPKGFCQSATDKKSGLFICTWNDNSIVSVLSNKYGTEPLKQANRRGKPVQVPYCVTQYNAGMLGVDLADWKTQKYRITIRSTKWYFSLFSHCIDVAVVNSHIIYNMMQEQKNKIDLLKFRTLVTTTLLRLDTGSKPQRQGVKMVPLPEDIALVGGNHILERTDSGKQRKCRICKKNARKQCVACNTGFHMDSFAAFHNG